MENLGSNKPFYMEENAALSVALLAGLATGINSLEHAVKSMVFNSFRSIFVNFPLHFILGIKYHKLIYK
jgi:hypothetical protein